MRWVRMGVYFAGQKNEDFSWGFSLTAQPRAFGYESSDSSLLSGMEDREDSWEGGLAFAMKKDNVFFEVLALHDLFNKSDGTLVRAELGADYRVGDWGFYPSVLAIWHSDNFNNYYYGVKESEANNKREEYTSNAGVDYAAQSYVDYAFNKKWHALFNLRVDYLNTEISNSPIVSDKYMASGLISIIYIWDLEL